MKAGSEEEEKEEQWRQKVRSEERNGMLKISKTDSERMVFRSDEWKRREYFSGYVGMK